jgi:hypothetical protein
MLVTVLLPRVFYSVYKDSSLGRKIIGTPLPEDKKEFPWPEILPEFLHNSAEEAWEMEESAWKDRPTYVDGSPVSPPRDQKLMVSWEVTGTNDRGCWILSDPQLP